MSTTTANMMDTRSPHFASLEEFARWCERAPPGTQLSAHAVAEIILAVEAGDLPQGERWESRSPSDSWTWRERLWTCPGETRLGVLEMAEALGRPKSWVYARTGPKSEDPIPHRKLDGALVFMAGELRAWIRSREEEAQKRSPRGPI